MYHACQLAMSFDADALQADLRTALDRAAWTPHFVTRNYEGDWSAIPLRSVGGRPDHIYSDPSVAPEDYLDTPMLADCPYFRQVLASFGCPVTSARLLKLAPGSRIKEHVDHDLCLDKGVVRLHIPVTTNPLVEIHIEDQRVIMAEGECWYIDATLRHRLANLGETDRVHIVFDCVVDDWLRRHLRSAGLQPRPVGFLEARGIRPQDLDKVIAAFRAMGTEAGLAMAEELEAARGLN